MSTIITRIGKGTPLTNVEVDTNFTNLNTDKIEAADTRTLTNKTIAFGSNTLTDVASTNTTQTLTNKTLTSPVISGGTINNTVIGGTTRAAGSFTTLDANGNVVLGDATSDTIAANGRFNTDVVPSTTNARDLGTSTLQWKQVYATTFTEGAFPVVTQTDIGTAPNQIPLNQYLGNLAYQNADAIAGPVVIGTESASPALRVTQTGTGNALVVEDSTSPDATPFVIDSGGNTIIGYTAPQGVQSAGSSATPIAQIVSGSASSALSIFNYRNATNINGQPALYFAKSRSDTVGTNTVLSSGDSTGRISFNGADGANFIESARITGAVDGTPGTNDMPGRLVFSTTPSGSGTPTERMRIDSSGNVIQSVPATAPTLATNGQMVFNLTSNTNLRVSVRGSDGVTRTADITLA